jgi:hydroxypyruvate isomerase
MEYRGHELSANVSMLFTELPYQERFAAAAAAGFRMVESWWPFASPAGSHSG